MIRFIIAAIFLILILLLSLIIIPIGLLVGLFSKRARHYYSRFWIRFAFRTFIFCSGAKIEYKGKENLIEDETVLYIMNHRSIFDIMITYVVFPGISGYVAKKEMEKLFIFTWWMKLINCLFLDRKDLRQGMETIKKGAENIKGGISMAICPEGTRNRTDEPMLEFHKGSFKIAEMAGSKIIPVVFNNTEDIFEKHFPKFKPAKVVVEFLAPIDVKALSMPEKKALSENVRTMMIDTYNKNAAN